MGGAAPALPHYPLNGGSFTPPVYTVHRALHDGRPGFPGADGRLPVHFCVYLGITETTLHN